MNEYLWFKWMNWIRMTHIMHVNYVHVLCACAWVYECWHVSALARVSNRDGARGPATQLGMLWEMPIDTGTSASRSQGFLKQWSIKVVHHYQWSPRTNGKSCPLLTFQLSMPTHPTPMSASFHLEFPAKLTRLRRTTQHAGCKFYGFAL